MVLCSAAQLRHGVAQRSFNALTDTTWSAFAIAQLGSVQRRLGSAPTMPLRFSKEPLQCEAATRSGSRCSITAASRLRDSYGRLAAAPLTRGGRHCAFHTPTFAHAPVHRPVGDVVVVYIDLETSGLDVLADEILEVAAAASCPDAFFSTTVRPTEMPAGPGVHGIGNDELLTSSPFNVVFNDLVGFLRGVSEQALADGGGSSSEDDLVASGKPLPSPKFPPPAVVLVAHNGTLAPHMRTSGWALTNTSPYLR